MSDHKLGVNTPIYPSITFGVDGARKPAEYFSEGIPDGEYLYGRFGHPNYKDLCDRLARMEGGERALVFGSGIAATFTLFLSQLSVGDHIVVSSRIYGGTRGQLAMLAQKLRLKVSVVDITDLAAVKRACTSRTKLMYAESVSNPEAVMSNIPELAQICHAGKNILLVIDNTFTPLIIKPLCLGADVVMHSLTKYVNGRSDALGGALIGRSTLMRSLEHPATGEASLIGGIMHPPLAQELAERFYQLSDRIHEASLRARQLAHLFIAAGLAVHYPLKKLGCAIVPLTEEGEELGGGVLSVAFPSEQHGVDFVHEACAEMCNDPLLGLSPLAISAVSLGSAHTYLWCTTEARAQSQVKKWSPLPFAPVPYGFVRIAVGYAGERSLQYAHFREVLSKLGYFPPSLPLAG